MKFSHPRMHRLILLSAGILLHSYIAVAADYYGGLSSYRSGDYAKAMQDWQQAAEQGNADAQYSLGYLYQFGEGTSPDPVKAAEWYGKAAAQGHADAQYALGQVRELGVAGNGDLAAARQSYRQAADQGHADAQYALGRMALRGRGTARDPKDALEWLTKAAAQNHPAALYQLGTIHETGWGVPADPVKAYVFYERARRAGSEALAGYDSSFVPERALEAVKQHMTPSQLKQAQGLVAELDKPSPEKK